MRSDIDRNSTKTTPLRIAVLGSCSVGKSALTVRFLTKRFIGEYRSDTDMLYKCSVVVDSASQPVEIMDTSSTSNDVTEAHLQWADAFILVYSIADKNSFAWVTSTVEILSLQRPSACTLIIACKRDLEHLREVEEVDGRCLAINHSSRFQELSSAEDYESVASTFESFLREVKIQQKSSTGDSTTLAKRKLSVSRMFGSLIGRGSPPPTPITQLIVLDRNEFCKSRAPIRHL